MKRVIWLMGVFCLLLTILMFVDTYGLFETNASASSELGIGEWKIKVNGTDITLSENITLSNFVYSSNQHVDNGYFAPGRNAEFEITIDTSESDVSVEYELEIDDSAIEDYPNIYFSILDLDTNQTITSNTYSGVILLGANSRTKRIKIYINWDNQLQYDSSDTSLIGENLSFVINADFKQYLGS